MIYPRNMRMSGVKNQFLWLSFILFKKRPVKQSLRMVDKVFDKIIISALKKIKYPGIEISLTQ